MTQDPSRWQPSTPNGSPDPLDDTQPVEVPRFVPTPDPRPDTRWAWAASESRPDPASWGQQRPQASRPANQPAWGGASAPAPRSQAPADPISDWPEPEHGARWSAPASSSTASWDAASGDAPETPDRPSWAPPVQTAPVRRSGPGVGTVAFVALLSAVLASSGTALALDASGAFNQPASAPAAANVPAASPATAGTATGPADDSTAVITSSAKVSPSVVKITTETTSTDPFSGSGEGIGSGIIYDSGGWILTNHHVVSGAEALTVELKDGRSFPGTVYGVDTLTDLAIVKVDATGLPAASLGSSDGLKVGQLVVAVGSPLGTYSFSVTSGIVSGKGRQIITTDGTTITNLIQTDAAINPGNSGGPLADADGDVVGINTAIADGSNGIGFAIPIDIAKPIMQQAVKGEKLERPWIGVYFEAIDEKVKEDQKLPVDSGALVINTNAGGGSAILPNSPAAAAGLKDLDIVTAINGIAVDQEHPLNLLLVQFAPNDVIKLTVIRDGQTLTIPLTLGIRPDTTP
ncbi:MAG: S1C family serine protease [Candidatus Limnocylindrales bacterium]